MSGTCTSSAQENELAVARARRWEHAYLEALSPRILRSVLIVAGLYLGAYSAICPLGGSHLPWTERLAYLGVSSALCAALCYSEYVVTLYLTRYWSAPAMAMAVAASVLVTAPTATAIAYGVDGLVHTDLPGYDVEMVFLFITLSILPCNAVVHYLVGQRLKSASAGGSDTGTPSDPLTPPPDIAAVPETASRKHAEPQSKFSDRLPPEASGDIIYLRSRDHYVEVVTTLGTGTVLMRLADAVAELGEQGVRVHRSYWVAHAHVQGWTRRNQRTMLRLTGGRLVPVSRSYLGAVRAALARHRVATREADGPPANDP